MWHPVRLFGTSNFYFRYCVNKWLKGFTLRTTTLELDASLSDNATPSEPIRPSPATLVNLYGGRGKIAPLCQIALNIRDAIEGSLAVVSSIHFRNSKICSLSIFRF